jgi:hypothetical protein
MDTDVVSTLAPGRQVRGADLVIAWLRKHEPALHFSTMTVMEVESGIARLPGGATSYPTGLPG